MSFPAFLRTRWAALRSVWARVLQRPEKLLSLHSLLWALMAAGLALLLYVLALIPFTPGIRDIRKAKTEQPAQLVAADGKLLAEYRWVNRAWVPLSEIAPPVVDALIATEDHRFYGHWGLDWRRTASALVRTLGGDKQGGSTITQQLARNLYPEDIGRAPTLTRKLKEAITALKIEALYSKDEILETYLNTVPFLYNAYGIEMAARTYFDKSADQLNVLESATLIGMLKGTAYYNPVLNPERAQARRNTVLAQMKKRGKLGEAEYAALSKRPLRIRFERQVETAGPAPHLAQQLRKQLIDWADRNGYSLYADGLVIRTTIDYRLQQLANQAVARQGRALQGVADGAWAARNAWNPKNPLVRQLVRESARYEAAVAKGAAPEDVLKDLLGDVAFLRTLRQEKTRVQAARRQPGSTFKPFVYGAAFDQGLLPTDTLMDAAVEIPLGNKQVWRPTDGNKPPSDMPMTLSDGLAFSKNTITAQLMQQVGPLRVAQLARAMGVRESKLDVVPSLALGTSPVSLKEMVAAYGAIASGGSYRAPRVITRIEDKNGKVLEDFAPTAPERVLGLTAAQQLRDAMRGVVDKGTGVAIRSRWGINADVAGKTGTTQDNTDGWFILMHPQLVAGAWVGFNDGRITLRSDYWGQGAHSALPMVGEVFQQALRAKVIDGKQRFIDEEESNWVGTAVAGVRNWVYDLFGRRTGGPEGPERTTGALPVPGTAPAEAERPEITEAPLVPLENAMPRVPPLPPVTYDEEPEATSPEMAPVPQPGVVITLPPPLQSQPQSGIVVTTPVQRGVVVPAPVPAQGNVPIWVESRP